MFKRSIGWWKHLVWGQGTPCLPLAECSLMGVSILQLLFAEVRKADQGVLQSLWVGGLTQVSRSHPASIR